MRTVYLIIGVSYALLILYTIHVQIIIEEKRLSPLSALGPALTDTLLHPFSILPLPKGTGLAILWLTIVLVVTAVLIYVSDIQRRGYRDQENVQGDAKWLEEMNEYNKKFTEPFGSVEHDGPNNMILSQDIFMSMNNQKIRRNMNVFVIGGSGAGK